MDVRIASLDHLRTLLDWAAAEGWNPGLRDAEAFHATDPEGFLLGWLDSEPIAGISLVRYDRAWTFLGLYIVRPEHRGQGHGLAIWGAAMARAEERSVGLDGVVAQQATYARSGFALVRRNVRYVGRAPLVEPAASATPGHGLLPAADVAFDTLARLDRSAFPAERPAFLRAWLGLPGHVGLVSTDGDGQPTGYGVIRRCREGWKVGPLLAPDEGSAERLLHGLAATAGPGDELFLDVPEPNRAAVRLAERHGMTPVFETARMVAGPVPDEPVQRIFGITTFELG